MSAPVLTANLPEPTYSQLFGADELIEAVTGRLGEPEAPGLVALTGPAGSGKDALAHACATRLAAGGYFHGLVWERLRPETDLAPAGKTSSAISPPDRLLDGIALQLGYVELVKLDFERKVAVLRARLKDTPYLIVIDDLGPLPETAALGSILSDLANPTKFLLAATALPPTEVPLVSFSIPPMPDQAALAYLRYLSDQRGLERVRAADDDALVRLNHLAAGRPLALQLLAGLVAASPERDWWAEHPPMDANLDWLYSQAWAGLSAPARDLLIRLLALPPAGGPLALIRALAEAPDERLEAGLTELWRAGLLLTRGSSFQACRLHLLTRLFTSRRAVDETPTTGARSFQSAVLQAARHFASAQPPDLADLLADRDRGLALLDNTLDLPDSPEIVQAIAAIVERLHPAMVGSGLWRLWHSYLLRVVERVRRHSSPVILGHMLMCRAEMLALMGDLEFSISRWREAHAYLVESGDELALAWLECRWAKVYIPLGQWRLAEHLLASALTRAAGQSDIRLEIEILHAFGNWHAKQNHSAEALETLERARQCALDAHWPLKEAEIWQTMALVAFQSGDWPSAQDRLEQALAVAGQADGGVGALPGQLHANLGLVHSYLGHAETARDELQRGLELASGLGDESTVCSCLNNLGLLAFDAGQWSAARSRFLQAVSINERIGDVGKQISSLGNLGMLAVVRGDPETAFGHLRQARQLATALNKVGDQAETELWLSAAHALAGQMDLALDISQHGLALAVTLGHKSLQVQLSLRRSLWLMAQSEPVVARASLEAALPQADLDQWESHRLRVLTALGQIDRLSGDQTVPASRLSEMAQLAATTHDPRLLVEYRWLLGDLAADRGDLAACRRHYDQALGLTQSAEPNDWLAQLQRETLARRHRLGFPA